jgi:carboxylesterase type B
METEWGILYRKINYINVKLYCSFTLCLDWIQFTLFFSIQYHRMLNATMKLLSLLLFAAAAESTDIIANTKDGVVRGVQVHDHVNAFLGIPYAQPPVNSLRFEPPRALDIPLGTAAAPFNATALGNACHQFMYRSVYGDSSRPSTPQSEDCLTLNVYVPKSAAAPESASDNGHDNDNDTGTATKLPVYVWSYGGGFGEGAGSVPLYNPTSFVVENKDIIVVTWK